MATATAARDDTFRKKERVVAVVDFPGIPAGTAGKVTFVAGFDWIRYWVRFDNGETKGSINRAKLARPDEWAEILERRARGEDDRVAVDNGSTPAEAAAPEAGEAVEDAAGGLVPAYLLERARARREALGKPAQ
jgi:hypothetical protein